MEVSLLLLDWKKLQKEIEKKNVRENPSKQRRESISLTMELARIKEVHKTHERREVGLTRTKTLYEE